MAPRLLQTSLRALSRQSGVPTGAELDRRRPAQPVAARDAAARASDEPVPQKSPEMKKRPTKHPSNPGRVAPEKGPYERALLTPAASLRSRRANRFHRDDKCGDGDVVPAEQAGRAGLSAAVEDVEEWWGQGGVAMVPQLGDAAALATHGAGDKAFPLGAALVWPQQVAGIAARAREAAAEGDAGGHASVHGREHPLMPNWMPAAFGMAPRSPVDKGFCVDSLEAGMGIRPPALALHHAWARDFNSEPWRVEKGVLMPSSPPQAAPAAAVENPTGAPGLLSPAPGRPARAHDKGAHALEQDRRDSERASTAALAPTGELTAGSARVGVSECVLAGEDSFSALSGQEEGCSRRAVGVRGAPSAALPAGEGRVPALAGDGLGRVAIGRTCGAERVGEGGEGGHGVGVQVGGEAPGGAGEGGVLSGGMRPQMAVEKDRDWARDRDRDSRSNRDGANDRDSGEEEETDRGGGRERDAATDSGANAAGEKGGEREGWSEEVEQRTSAEAAGNVSLPVTCSLCAKTALWGLEVRDCLWLRHFFFYLQYIYIYIYI